LLFSGFVNYQAGLSWVFSIFVKQILVMKNLLLATLFLFAFSIFSGAQNSRKGVEYTGSKLRVSLLGKSRMFTEGVKTIPYTIYWNKKKNTVSVESGEKDKWYVIELTGMDTVQGVVSHVGFLEGMSKETDFQKREKAKCEVRFMVDKVSIKIGESKLEEYLVDGATVWNDQTTGGTK